MRNGHGLELGPDATGEAAYNFGLSWVQIEIDFPHLKSSAGKDQHSTTKTKSNS